MKLHVIDFSGKLRTLDISPSMKIEDIKQMLYITSINLDASVDYDVWEKSVALYLGDSQLDSSKPLSDYAVNEETTINMVLKQAPDEFYCPITEQIFLDPVKSPYGHTFEREAITRWLTDHTTCPVTRGPLTLAQLTIPDTEIKKQIQDFFQYFKDSTAIDEIKNDQYTPQPQAAAARAPTRTIGSSPADILRRIRQRDYTRGHSILVGDDESAWRALRNATDEYLRGSVRPGRTIEPLMPSHSEEDNSIRERPILPPQFPRGTLFRSHGRDNINEQHLDNLRDQYLIRQMQETIDALERYGITEAVIQQYWQPSYPNERWDRDHKEILIYFVTGQFPAIFEEPDRPAPGPLALELQLNPVNALQEISRLRGSQLHALSWLYPHGLRGDHLRNWHGTANEQFTIEHTWALQNLVLDQGLTIEDAIQRITGISADEAKEIWIGQRAGPR